MAQGTKTKTGTPKGRVLTPSELELAEALSKALVNKIGAQLALNTACQEIARLTGEINKLGVPGKGEKINYPGVARATAIWCEAYDLAGLPQAPTASELVRR